MTSKAWYRDVSEENLHEPHHANPPRFLTSEQMFEKSGVRLRKVENCDDEEELARIRRDGGYKFYDWLDVSRDALPDYDERLKKFYTEHLHEDDEVRLVTAGGCFFEVRDAQDSWIRLHIQRGDLLQLPAGIYHRMTLNSEKYVKMLRLYTDQPQWTAINRPEGDRSPARETYLSAYASLTEVGH